MSSRESKETFIKNFNINTDITDVKFRKLNVEPYQSLEQDQQFGEKKCLLHHCECTIYNINITIKVLSFAYVSHSEVLKLDIAIYNELLTKEIASCKNFLQRKRNMNLVFEVLVKFIRLFEMRRLICQTVFQQHPNVLIIEDDFSILIKCCSQDFSIKYLELNWTINWNVDTYEISDCIEFYCNYLVLRKNCGDSVREKLLSLAQPNVDFQPKLKLWRMLMKDLYDDNKTHVTNSRNATTQTNDICEISDSDSDDSVVEINSNIYTESRSDEILVIE